MARTRLPWLALKQLLAELSVQPEPTSPTEHAVSRQASHRTHKQLAAEDDTCQQLLAIGLYHAHRRDLLREEAEDCATEFVARRLHEVAQTPGLQIAHWFEREGGVQALHRLADNQAHDWARRRDTYVGHFGAELSEAVTEKSGAGCATEARSLSEQVIQQAFLDQVEREVSVLPAAERALLLAYCGQERTPAELAGDYEVTVAVIWQRVRRLRGRLTRRLQASGWMAEEPVVLGHL
jgi:DNA-directed RNA polymerase specialized sigma24 family protein